MAFTDAMVQSVWNKAHEEAGNDPAVWRKDDCGAWIGRAQYGDRRSQYGWEIDHIKAVANRGGDELSNLRPLQWENNACKQDDRLVCVVRASGIENVRVKGVAGGR